MSYWVKDYTKFNDVTIDGTTYNGIVGHCLADTASDLPPRIQGTKALLIGSECEIVSTGDKYTMDTYGNWHLQPRETSVALDLSGYYTSAEVEQAISDAIRAFIVGDTIQANYDLNNFTTVGHMNCAATIANSCANRPLGMNQTGGFGVTNTLIYSADGTTDKVRQDLIYNVTGSNLAKNRAFWRIYSSAGWSPWFEDDKTEVVIT